ncbi:hypothetical protein EVAR_12992_1 [Eumeta japonica]|uniref:Uncharacterized protein n=1 Tax=Eumeta variegata TaxID=151549 RepID=A0A4C1TWV1_EUMVA|nr:hypothetical protein EVAR_12992_1 [Eumeta japonica]
MDIERVRLQFGSTLEIECRRRRPQSAVEIKNYNGDVIDLFIYNFKRYLKNRQFAPSVLAATATVEEPEVRVAFAARPTHERRSTRGCFFCTSDGSDVFRYMRYVLLQAYDILDTTNREQNQIDIEIEKKIDIVIVRNRLRYCSIEKVKNSFYVSADGVVCEC